MGNVKGSFQKMGVAYQLATDKMVGKSPPLQVDVLSLTKHFFQVCLVVCYVFFHLLIFNYIVTHKCR